MTILHSFVRTLTCIGLIPLITSCGGGAESLDAAQQRGRIIIKIGDEPLDAAQAVNLQFRAITLVNETGQEVTRAFEPPKVGDVLQYQRGLTALLADWQVPAGEYRAIRLSVDAQLNVRDSYVSLHTGEECELIVQDPAGWTVFWPAGQISRGSAQPTVLLLHIDLLASVRRIDCVQGVQFVPTIDLVEEARSGWFEGSVDLDLYGPNCMPKVYVGLLDPLLLSDVSPARRPRALTRVYSENGRAYYRTPNLYPLNTMDQFGVPDKCPMEWERYGFCPQTAAYSVAFTCDEDDPSTQQTLNFTAVSGGTIQEGKASPVDLAAPPP